MPINYGLFNLTNSNLVPKKRLFPVEAYMKAAGERQEWWNQAFANDMQTKQQADAMPWLPSDEQEARGLQREFQGRVQGRTAEGDLENHVYDTIRDAQEFRQKSQAFSQTYAQRQQQEAELRKNAATMQWSEADIQKNMAASDRMYQASGGVRKDEETGQYRGSYRGLQAVARPDLQKITDEAIKGMKENARSWETLANGNVIITTHTGSREEVTAARVQAAIQEAMQLNPAASNWITYEAQANTLSNPIDPSRMTPEMKAQLQPYLDKGLDPGSAQYAMNYNKTLNEMLSSAERYGVNKAAYLKTTQGIGNMMATPGAGDNAFLPPVMIQGAPVYDQGAVPNKPVLYDKKQVEKSVKDQKEAIARLEAGPNPNQNTIHNEKQKLAGMEQQLGKLNNIERNAKVDVLDKHTGGKGVEVANLMDELDKAPTDSAKRSILAEIRRLMPEDPYATNTYGRAPTERPSWGKVFSGDKTSPLDAQIRNLKNKVEDATKEVTSKIKPESTGETRLQLDGSQPMKWLKGTYEKEVANNPDGYEYLDRTGRPTKGPDAGEHLESVSDMVIGANGQRYLNARWTKGTGANKSEVFRRIPMNDRNNNIGKIGDQMLVNQMQVIDPNNALFADVRKTYGLITGTDNEVLAPGLNPMESTWAIDERTGKPRSDIQIQRYQRDNLEGGKTTTFRLLDAQGKPLMYTGTDPGAKPVEIETGNARDINTIIAGYLNIQKNAR